MAFSFFGKKDKNPSEAPAPVAKAPPTPPKIQPPPGAPAIPAVKPPQPSGLIPASGMPAGAATTQPMVMPRTGAGGGLKPARPGVVQSTRSTQRIVLPGGVVPGKPTSNTKSLAGIALPPAGRINLPVGMILRCMPGEVVAGEIADFEASGAAATEIGLPTNLILPQLPSGKVEISLADLVPHFPAGFLQPTASITNYLPTMISLPLMDVVMRIPPDLLALRPDQKGVDAAVINMADPFTEEILREQAEAARRQAQAQAATANVIDESQVPPAEEFVPQQQPPAPKTIAPPPRPATTGSLPPVVPGAHIPGPTVSSRLPGAVGSPSISARTISPSPSGRLPGAPTRATAAIPARSQRLLPQQPPGPPSRPTAPIPPAPVAAAMPAAPVPPVPRQTSSLPLPPLANQSAVLPQPPTGFAVPTAPVAITEPAPEPEPTSEPIIPTPGQPDAAADDLQRLAALAMAQLGDAEEASPEAEQPTEPTGVPSDQAVTAPLSPYQSEAETAAPLPPEPELEPTPEPVAEPAIPSPTSTSSLPAITPLSVIAAVPSSKPPTAPLPPVTALPIAPAPPAQPEPVAAAAPVATPEPEPELAKTEEATAFNLNTCTEEDLLQIPGCYPDLAKSIVQHRALRGSFKGVEDLLDVPGMTKAAYVSLTGENPPENRIPLTLNDLLGFPADQHVSLKDVTDRICCWPDVTGCVLSQGSGLSLVGQTPPNIDKAALVAFVPRMFESLNKSFAEIVGKQTDDIVIPTPGTSFHILRAKDLFLIILCRLPQMPERHLRVARYVLTLLSIRSE